MKKILEVNNLKKVFKKANGESHTAVNGISFDLYEGEVFSFLGPNGAGKSTTINMVTTQLSLTSGTIKIDSEDIKKNPINARTKIGIVAQHNNLDRGLTAHENLLYHGRYFGLSKEESEKRAESLLKDFGLYDWKDDYVKSFSGGMAQRLKIARAIMHKPAILFLDEPTTGLDPHTRAHIWEYIVKLQKERNITIFLTTHYMEEAEICDQIAIIDGGRIVAHDTPYALKKKYTKDRAYITTKESEKLEQLLISYQLNYEKKEGYYRVEAEDITHLLQVLSLHKDAITDIEIRKGTFNDVFLEITGRKIREEE